MYMLDVEALECYFISRTNAQVTTVNGSCIYVHVYAHIHTHTHTKTHKYSHTRTRGSKPLMYTHTSKYIYYKLDVKALDFFFKSLENVFL